MADLDLTPRIGKYITTTMVGYSVKAYVPKNLPPVPLIDMQSLSNLVSDAMLALGLGNFPFLLAKTFATV